MNEWSVVQRKIERSLQVPGGDQARDTDRHPLSVTEADPGQISSLFDAVEDATGKESKVVSCTGDVDGPRQLHGLALVLGLCLSKLVESGLDQVGDAVHDLGSLGTACLGPAWEGLGGGLVSELDVGLGRVWDLGMGAAMRGLEGVKVLSGRGLDVLVVDKVIEGLEGTGGCGHGEG